MKKHIAFLIICTMLFSCSEIIQEKDISNQNVILVAPANNTAFFSTGVSLTWEKLDDALSYQLQIAKPNFTNPQQIVLDTTITATTFTQQLPIGEYEWRVRGINGSSNTNYSNRFFSVVSNADFQSNTVVLTSPSNNLITNSSAQNLTWQPVLGTVDYKLQVYNSANTILLDQTVTTNNYNYNFPEGTIQWRVKASNGTEETLYSSRSIVVDTTVPNTPTLTSPVNASTVNTSNVSFQWSRTPVSGSAELDSIYIYSDSQLTILTSKNQVTSPYSATLSTGTYYWKIRAFDAAKNAGNSSAVFNVIVN